MINSSSCLCSIRRHPARIASAVALALILFSVTPFAQGQGETPMSATAQPAPLGTTSEVRTRAARIAPGDLVGVKVFGVPEASQDLRVSNTGTILLPLIGVISAQGLTTEELEQKIAAALRSGGFVNDPQVNVSAKELRSAGVSVTGEVNKPGIYPVFGGCSLLEMISAAGGTTARSGRLVTITHADQPDKPVNVDISSAFNRDVQVFPGDMVVITKAGVVYVLGAVGHAAGLVMERNERMTVIQALVLAGGASKDASLKHTRIIRKTPEGTQEFPVPLKEILSAKVNDVELLPGDVLFIPPSKGLEAFWRNENSILQAATAVAIFRP